MSTKVFFCFYHYRESYFLKIYLCLFDKLVYEWECAHECRCLTAEVRGSWILWSPMWMLGSDLGFSARAALNSNHWSISLALGESHFLGGCPVDWGWDLCPLLGWERVEHLIHGPDYIVLSVEGASFPQSRDLRQNENGEGSPALNM